MIGHQLIVRDRFQDALTGIQGWNIIISIALNTGLFKTEGIRGSDRGTNYNRNIEIEHEPGSQAVYAVSDYRRRLI